MQDLRGELIKLTQYLYEMDRIRLDDQVPPFETIEMIVDGYIKAKVKPIGAYVQLGQCFAGKCTYIPKENIISDKLLFIDDIGEKIKSKEGVIILEKQIDDFLRKMPPISIINTQLDYEPIAPLKLNEPKWYNKFDKKRKKSRK